MTPELNEDEMRLLHKEAMELYDLYFKPDAKHKIGVGEHISKEIFSSNNNKKIFDINFRLFFKQSVFSIDADLVALGLCYESIIFLQKRSQKKLGQVRNKVKISAPLL